MLVGGLVCPFVGWSVCSHITLKTGYVAIASRLGFGNNLVYKRLACIFLPIPDRGVVPCIVIWNIVSKGFRRRNSDEGVDLIFLDIVPLDLYGEMP
jgi:hypothetical protein